MRLEVFTNVYFYKVYNSNYIKINLYISKGALVTQSLKNLKEKKPFSLLELSVLLTFERFDYLLQIVTNSSVKKF